MEDVLGVIFVFGGGTIVALAMSPLGRALAARIQGHGSGSRELQGLRESHDALVTELDTVRQDVAELQERLDFAERALARRRDEPGLPPAAEGQGRRPVQP